MDRPLAARYAVAMEPDTTGARLRRARQARRLSQERMAEALRTDQSTISDWETGKQEPIRERLSERLRAAGIDPAEVYPEDLAQEGDPPAYTSTTPLLVAEVRQMLSLLAPHDEAEAGRLEEGLGKLERGRLAELRDTLAAALRAMVHGRP